LSLEIYTVNRQNVGGLNALIYGYQGTGKTVLSAQAQEVPAMRNVLFLNTEKGLMSVADRDDIAAVDIEDASQVEEVFWWFANGAEQVKGFNTVVIDSITELQELDLEKRSKSKGGKRTLDMYGDSTSYIKRIVRQFRDLKALNVILVALPTELTDEDGAVIGLGPMLTGKLAASVMGYMDAVWYLYVRKGDKKRVLLTQPTKGIRAKTRSLALPDEIVEPSLGQIHDLLNGSTVKAA
jgi:phage nucleotide-binding protein